MKLVHAIVHVCVVLVLVFLGLYMMWYGLSLEKWGEVIEKVQDARAKVVWAGLALFLLGALLILAGRKPKSRAKFLSFDSAGGRVNVSTDAVVNYVSRISDEFPAILKMRPHVVAARNAIDIVVDLKVKSGSQINELCEQLQGRIKEGVVSGLGITQVRRVEVSVRELADDTRSS